MLFVRPRLVRIGAGIVFLSLFSMAGCLRRSFNVPYQDKRASGPADGQELTNALYEGARAAEAGFSRTDFEAFFDPFAVDLIKAGDREKFIESVNYNCPPDWCLKRSSVSPVWLSRAGFSGIPSGGLILFQNDLFPEGYFRQRADQISLKELMTGSPWFEWDASKRKFIARKGGAPERILKKMFELRGVSDDFELYRGAGIEMNNFSASDRNPYDSGKSELKEVMFFSSPSVNTALAWANPAVWSSKIPRSELLAGVAGEQPVVYVGFEYNYPEIAFLRSKLVPQPVIIRNGRARLVCVSKDKVAGDSKSSTAARDSGMPPALCDPAWQPAHTSGFPLALSKVKTASVKSDALIKLTAVADKDLPEGNIVCRLKRGMQIQYLDAFKMPAGQVWIHSRGLKPEWNCPRSFLSDKFYLDEENVDAELTP
jgi:hypothetical protein